MNPRRWKSRMAAAVMMMASGLTASNPAILFEQVDHVARSVQPGEVVQLRFRSTLPLDRAEVRIFDRTFPFYRDDDGFWKALVGIDLGTQPGEYRAELRAWETGGHPSTAAYPLEVKSKQFPTRRLTVDQKFVNPPQAELPRIRRESKRVSEIFATVTPARLWRGPFSRPVPGAATSSFGKRSILNGKPRSPHTGTDFDADSGTPVTAPNGGEVVLADNLYYSGNTVILDHGQGLYSYLAHLSEIDVREGDPVKKGQTVGRVGATGRVTGPHLHWTLRLLRTRVDPLSLMAVLEE